MHAASSSSFFPSRAIDALVARYAAFALRSGGAIALLLGLIAFIPYPAIPVGNNSALQIGNLLVLALLAAPAIALPWLRRPYFIFPALLLALVLALLRVSLMQPEDLPVCVRSSIMVTLSLLTIVAVQIYAPRFSLELMTGIACATMLHAAVGAWQLYGFSTGQMPLLWIYVNPSFASVQSNVDNLLLYIQRPFGIFPEPSAMAASLAPWIILWTAERCGLVHFARTPGRWQRHLFGLASVAGLALIVLSRSGHLVVTLGALSICGAVWLRNCRATFRTLCLLALLFCGIVPVVAWLASASMNERIQEGGVTGGSWGERSSSLVIGLDIVAHSDLSSQIFGIGMDLMSPAIWNKAGIGAVYSVLLQFVYETGIVGAFVVCWIGAELARTWRVSRLNAAYALMAIVWLAGITLTTSYAQLLPLWVALGWLTVWPTVCLPPSVGRSSRPANVARARSTPPIEHRSAWE